MAITVAGEALDYRRKKLKPVLILGVDIQILGAATFGILIGWFIYFSNRYRKGEVQLNDVATLMTAIAGGAVFKLFELGHPNDTVSAANMFGAYGLGLFLGFFCYFLFLVFAVAISKNFTFDWFLDGRAKAPGPGEIPPNIQPTVHPMDIQNPTSKTSATKVPG